MKKLNYLLLFVFAVLLTLSGCKNDDDPSTEETPLQKRVTELAKTWETGTVTDEGTGEKISGTFSITFSRAAISGESASGSYTSEATGAISGIVEGLPPASDFTIAAASSSKITLSNGEVITLVSVSADKLVFEVTGKTGKEETTITYDLVPAE